jgi:hypothetical protein
MYAEVNTVAIGSLSSQLARFRLRGAIFPAPESTGAKNAANFVLPCSEFQRIITREEEVRDATH